MNSVLYPISRPLEIVLPTYRYLNLHCLALLGYAVLGKAFAYLGYHPLYIGEVLLATGLIHLALHKGLPIFQSSSILLFLLMLWGATCTVPYIQRYGILALRDAVIWGYGLFAFLIASAIVARPATFSILLDRYRSFSILFLLLSPIVWLISTGTGIVTVETPGGPAMIIKNGDLMVHLTRRLRFHLSKDKATLDWLALALATPLWHGFGCEGWCSECIRSIGFLVVVNFRAQRVIAVLLVVSTLVLVANLLDLRVKVPGVGREMSVRSLTNGLASVFVNVGAVEYDSTKAWRVRWWSKIVSYTFEGPYFWTGKGFGVNLAHDDGFNVDTERSLRSPHNGHLTFLARTGVPGSPALDFGSGQLGMAGFRVLQTTSALARSDPGLLSKNDPDSL